MAIQIIRFLRFARAAAWLFCCALGSSSAAFAAPRIMVSIKPFYNLCAAILGELSQSCPPHLLLQGNASPHDFQLKPSDMQHLAKADLIIWGGPALENFLDKPLKGLQKGQGKSQVLLTLMDLPGLHRLPLRSHHGDHHGHCKHGHGPVGEGEIDPHFWLSPHNAMVVLQAITLALIESDPERAALYQSNRDQAIAALQGQIEQIREQLKPWLSAQYLAFHDAYQYFEESFGLLPLRSIAIHPEIPPSAKRLQMLREAVQRQPIACVFSEPQFNDKIIQQLLQGTSIPHRRLDPLGQDADLGPLGYQRLMAELANAFSRCSTASAG